MTRTLVIGSGTGRDGTTTLSRLLSHQGLGSFPHEAPEIPRHKDHLAHRFHTPWLNGRLARYDRPWSVPIRGEVSLSWSSWIPDIRNWAVLHDVDVKFVFNRRDLDEVVPSMIRKNGREFNHWSLHLGEQPDQQRNVFSTMFPLTTEPDKEFACAASMRQIRRELEVASNASDTRWMDLQDYNDGAKCLELLRWIGFEAPQYHRFHENANQ